MIRISPGKISKLPTNIESRAGTSVIVRFLGEKLPIWDNSFGKFARKFSAITLFVQMNFLMENMGFEKKISKKFFSWKIQGKFKNTNFHDKILPVGKKPFPARILWWNIKHEKIFCHENSVCISKENFQGKLLENSWKVFSISIFLKKNVLVKGKCGSKNFFESENFRKLKNLKFMEWFWSIFRTKVHNLTIPGDDRRVPAWPSLCFARKEQSD